MLSQHSCIWTSVAEIWEITLAIASRWVSRIALNSIGSGVIFIKKGLYVTVRKFLKRKLLVA